jgi:hypothetical protein
LVKAIRDLLDGRHGVEPPEAPEGSVAPENGVFCRKGKEVFVVGRTDPDPDLSAYVREEVTRSLTIGTPAMGFEKIALDRRLAPILVFVVRGWPGRASRHHLGLQMTGKVPAISNIGFHRPWLVQRHPN